MAVAEVRQAMKKKVALLISGGIVSLLPVFFVVYAVRGAPSGASTPPRPSACPTIFQPTYPPLFTVNPAERSIPGEYPTRLARYHATYPVDSYQGIHTRDLAPQVPLEKKSPVIVQHPDCSFEELLIPFDQSTTYINALPAGDTVVVAAPPPEAYHPPVIPNGTPTPRPGQTPGMAYGKNGKPITITITPPGGQPSPPSSALQTNVAHDVATFTKGNQTAFAKQTASAAPQRTPTP